MREGDAQRHGRGRLRGREDESVFKLDVILLQLVFFLLRSKVNTACFALA